MKKLFAILLVIALAIPGVAYAADPGWSISYNGESDRTAYFAEVTSDYYFDDFSSMRVKWGSNTDANVNMEIKNTFAEAAPAGEYVLKFYARGQGKFSNVNVGSQSFAVGDLVVDGDLKQGNDNSGDWKEYTKTITLADSINSLTFVFHNKSVQFYDMVSFVNTTTNKNYIIDGSFEEYMEPEAPDVAYDRTDYAVKHLRASSKNANGLVVSWINPKTTDLAGISLYDITGGKNELLAEGLDITPEKSVYYEIPNLSTGVTYQYKVVYDFGAKGKDTYFVHGTPSSSITTKKGTWDLGIWRNGKAKFCPGETVIDTTTSHGDGNASLKISINVDENARFGEDGTALRGDIYCKATQPVQLTGGKYKVSFWAKAENMMVPTSDNVYGPRVTMDFANFEGVTHFITKPGNDWTEYEYIYDYDKYGKDILTITFDRKCDGWWIDDIEVRKYNTETMQAEGPNLVSDPGFEDLVSTSTGTVASVTATPGIGSVTLSDIQVTGSYNEIDLYQKVYDNYEYRGTISGEVTSVEFEDLKKDELVTFKLIPVNSDGVEGTAKETEPVKTVLPEYEIGEASLYKSTSAEKQTQLSGIGSYNVIIPVKNSLISGGLPYDGMAALYKDGALVKLFSSAGSVRKTSKNAVPTDISVPVQITEAGNYTLEFYLIDSRASLKNYCKAYVWTSPAAP